jgi:hypothetical protein
MKKLFAVVAVAAFALTWAVPMAQAAASATQIHKSGDSNVHKAAQKKKTTKSKSTKKKASLATPTGAPKA